MKIVTGQGVLLVRYARDAIGLHATRDDVAAEPPVGEPRWNHEWSMSDEESPPSLDNGEADGALGMQSEQVYRKSLTGTTIRQRALAKSKF